MAITKKRNTGVAKALLELGIEDGEKVWAIKSPKALIEHSGQENCRCYACEPGRTNLTMYGLKFTEGVAVTTDEQLARRCVAEFPEYTLSEL
jgi:hypothetical protein